MAVARFLPIADGIIQQMLEMVMCTIVYFLPAWQEKIFPKGNGRYHQLARRDIAAPVVLGDIGINSIRTMISLAQLPDVQAKQTPRNLSN